MDKLITKVHASILNIHGLVGEKEATKWLSDSQKSTVSASHSVKPAPNRPTTRTGKAAAAAAAASTIDEPVEGGSSGGQGSSGSATRNAEKEILAQALRLQYVHLIEMDEILREKLFILQVDSIRCRLTERICKTGKNLSFRSPSRTAGL